MSMSGKYFTFEFWEAIFGSFHFVILPRKMSAIVGPSNCNLGLSGRLYVRTSAPATVGMCWILSEALARFCVAHWTVRCTKINRAIEDGISARRPEPIGTVINVPRKAPLFCTRRPIWCRLDP